MNLTQGAAALSTTLVLSATFALPLSAQTAPHRILLRAGHLLDVRTGNEPTDQTIIVQGENIAAISPTAATPAIPATAKSTSAPTPSSPASSMSTPTSPAPPTSTPTSNSA